MLIDANAADMFFVYSGSLGTWIPQWEYNEGFRSEKYNHYKKALTGPGQNLIYGAIDFDEYAAYQAQCDTIRKEWLTNLVTGQMPIDLYSEFIEEWTSRSGNVYIQEATEQYNSYMDTH